MASVTITLTDVCSGGNHLTFEATGARSMTMVVDLDELTQPVTDDDAKAFIRVVSKLARSGRTLAAARTLLQAGVVVDV